MQGDRKGRPIGVMLTFLQWDRRSPRASPRATASVAPTFRDGLALVQWDEFYVHWAGVVGFGTDQAVVADLLENMGGPACRAAHGEGGREEVTGQADGGQQGGRIEFHVGVEAAARVLFLPDSQSQRFD